MNIKNLKDKIKDLPDDMLVVISGSDHSYSKYVSLATTTLEYDPKHGYLGEQNTNDETGSESGIELIEVLWIG